MRVLSASQREHAAHAGLQEAVFQIWDWIYDALLKTTQQRDAMYKLLLSAAHTHIGVAGVQCRVWEWIAFFEDFYDIEEECPPLDETSVSAFRARDAARTRLAFSLLVSALYFHMANAQVVQSCLKCMRFFTNDNLIMDASDAIFEAYRTHGRDADSLSGVWSALSSLVFCCTFEHVHFLSGPTLEKHQPVLAAVYAAVLETLIATQQQPESLPEDVFHTVTSFAELNDAGLDVCAILKALLPVFRGAKLPLPMVEAVHAIKCLAGVVSITADDVETVLSPPERRSGVGYTGLCLLLSHRHSALGRCQRCRCGRHKRARRCCGATDTDFFS